MSGVVAVNLHRREFLQRQLEHLSADEPYVAHQWIRECSNGNDLFALLTTKSLQLHYYDESDGKSSDSSTGGVGSSSPSPTPPMSPNSSGSNLNKLVRIESSRLKNDSSVPTISESGSVFAVISIQDIVVVEEDPTNPLCIFLHSVKFVSKLMGKHEMAIEDKHLMFEGEDIRSDWIIVLRKLIRDVMQVHCEQYIPESCNLATTLRLLIYL
jgi:hypothetical protein